MVGIYFMNGEMSGFVYCVFLLSYSDSRIRDGVEMSVVRSDTEGEAIAGAGSDAGGPRAIGTFLSFSNLMGKNTMS